ncbi:MAG: acyltransferase [Verrucomicrobia bacterium]|nr:acyltransferase [Verrucomicrobiota bacterium]
MKTATRTLPSFRLARLLQRDANNLDLIRLVCSCLVIFGHAFVLVQDPDFELSDWDPFTWLGYPGVYSASVAVKIFFFISGVLVTNSLLTKRSVTGFLLGRFWRIWPALLVTLALTAFVVGPLFTQLTLTDYFTNPWTYHYVWGNLCLLAWNNLPGVFQSNPTGEAVNGSLWTLAFEVGAYLITLILWLVGAFRQRWVSGLLLVLITIDPLRGQSGILPWIDSNPQVIWLPFCFGFGAFLAVMADRVVLHPGMLAAILLLFYPLRHSAFGQLLGLVFLLGTVLYVSGLTLLRKLRLRADLSYGAYISAYPIQQMLVAKFPHWSLPVHFVATLAGALIFGYFSWHLIERPALRARQRWADGSQPTEVNCPIHTL